MYKNISVFLFLFLFNVNVYSQQGEKMNQLNNVNNVEDFLQMGKKSIVDLAVRQLEDDDMFEDFNIDLFNDIRVYYDKKLVWVSFSQNIRYVPWNSAFAYEVTIFLFGQQSTSCSLLENPENMDGGPPFPFYQYSSGDKETLAEVLKFIKIEPGQSVNETITIYNNPEYYDVQIMGKYSAEFYKIRKSDMTVFDEMYEELALMEEDETMELK